MKKPIIVSLAIALIFFISGYFLGADKVNPTEQLAKGANTYQAGWDAAKKRLSDSGFAAAPMADFEINNVFGQVTAVKGNDVTLKINPLEPLADPDLDERTIKIDNNTKIYIQEQKDQVLYQNEMEEFNKKMQEQMNNLPVPGEAPAIPADPITPPEFYTKKQASLSDIKTGAQINVIAVDKDIKNTKQFSAAEINIQPAPAGITGAPAADGTLPPPVK